MPFASRSAPPLQPTSAALASLTLSFPDALYPVSVCSTSPTSSLERTLKRRLSAVLPIIGTRRAIRDSDSSICARVSVKI